MPDGEPRCPISTERIDENVARVNGGIATTVLAVALLTPYRWVLAYLVLDYALKVVAGFAYSPSCRLANLIARGLRLPERMVDSAPKRFAAVIGLAMSALGLVAAYGFPAASAFFYGVVGTFLVFAALESLAGFCTGCWLYGLLPERVSAAFVRRMRGGPGASAS